MRGKKNLVASLFYATGVSRAILAFRLALVKELPILAYHRIFDDWQDETFAFDPELVSATSQEFEWQMKRVKSSFTPVTFNDVVNHLTGKKPLPRNPIIVTFDDGYEDNYTHAFPILKKLEIPATIFLATGYLDGKKTFWYDWLYHLCRAAANRGDGIEFDGRVYAFSKAFEDFYHQYSDVISHAKRMPDPSMRQEIDSLAKKLNMHCPADGFVASRPLRWDQVREMAANGIEFGSHTITHPVLSNLTGKELVTELTHSKAEIEAKTNREVTAIAYPVGEEFAFNDEVIGGVRNSGYAVGVSYISGTNRVESLSRFLLKRIRVERYTSRADFQMALAVPGW